MQKLRQEYMTELLERILVKKETMQEAAELGERCAQTFQRWFGDQILLSVNYLSLQFVEEVLSYAMKQLQRQKLETLIDNLNVESRKDSEKAWITNAA